MERLKYLTTIIFSFFLFASFTTPAVAAPEKVTRRDIDIIFESGKVDDGFGNIRKILVNGTIRNNAPRIASKVTISFKLIWKNRTPDVRKVEFQNVEFNIPQNFDFFIELGTQPDTLKSLVCNIDQIKFTNTREASPLTPFNLVLHEMYTLTRLNEEGKSFSGILNFIKEANPFQLPVKDEFETTSEHENRVNQAENNHFSKLMDELEKRYGQLLGGNNAVIRFLPRTFNKNIIYLSECSAFFQIPVQFGKFNADMNRFENVAMNPRTFAFPLQTSVPSADLQFIHKAGLFFLRKTQFSITRAEAITWREQEKYLMIEATIRLGVKQDGPYLTDFCIIEKVILKNGSTGTVYREWLISS